MTPEQEVRRATARKVESPKPLSLAAGVSLRMSELLRLDEGLTEADRIQAARQLPRNRAEARRFLKGRGTPKRV